MSRSYSMIKFNVYFSDKMKIDVLQRIVLIHSYLYYIEDNPVWTDKKYDEVSKKLLLLQKTKSKKWIKNNTQYGYCFFDFDGNTGFDLWYRLTEEDRKKIKIISNVMRT